MVGGSDGDFGVWVRQRRRSLLLTQEELAERAKISVRTVQMIESDRATTIRAATRRQLLEVLGPPVEAPRVVPAQLPGDLAAFAGRTGHLATLDSLVAGAPAAVIISAVSGTAGVGKTTLAVHWAHRVAGEFPDGQLYVNLRGFDPVGAPAEPAEVIRGFLDALGVPADRVPADLPAQVALYRSLIAGKRILVILDNARDAAQVRPLLPGSRGAFALITSRSQLTPLVATDGAAVMRLELLSAPEATELLAARLGADRLAAEPEATRQILDACAGLPLALAIAAARALQTGSPLAGLAAELTDRLAALDAGDPATQVATVFSWSYATLSPPAGSLFRLLGRDPAPQTAEAAAALAGQDVTEPLAELVTANLLSSCAGGRFAMHDLLRAYAADLAARRDPPEVLRAATQRLLDHYTHAAHEASRQLYPHRDPIPLPVPPGDFIPFSAAAWFAAEHRVLLAAVRYAAAAGFDEHAWQLAWCLDTFLYRQGHWHELEAAWTAALPAAARLGGRCEAYAHQRLARPATRFGRYAEARAHIRKALDHYTAAGDLIGQADTHCSLVPIWDLEGGYAEALHHVEQASALYQAAGHRRGHAVTLSNMGWFRARLGDLRAAQECCAPTLAMFRELGDRTGEAGACSTLGFIQHRMERYAEAAASYRRALELYREIGDRYNEAGTLSRLGDTHLAAGNVAAAREVLAQALAIYTDLGHDDAATIRATLESCGQTAGLLRGAAAGAPIASTS